MGVILCSQVRNPERNNLREFHCTGEWQSSDEPWDTDGDNQYYPPDTSGSISSSDDFLRELQTDTKMRRAKYEGLSKSRMYPMGEEMKDCQRSSVVNREGELQAYSKMVANDTLEHLHHTIGSANSLVDKATDINDELARQERVLSKAEADIAIAEYQTDLTIDPLEGMKSLKSKLARVIWKKKPKLRINDFVKETRTVINLNLDLLNGDVGICAFSNMNSSKVSNLSKNISGDTDGTQQIQIKAGIGQLHQALDAITPQQMDTARALDQKGRLSAFENRMTTVNQKINRQSEMINTILGK